MITVIGLGPGELKYLTLEAKEKIEGADCLIARTEQHQAVEELRAEGFEVRSYDSIYNGAATFEEVYEKIVQGLLEKQKSGDVCYLLPGNPSVFEKTTDLLKEKLSPNDLEIVHGVSFLDMIFTKTGVDPLKGLYVLDALDLDENLKPKAGCIIVAQCYDRMIASTVKLYLGEIIDDEAEIMVLNSLGTKRENIIKMPLYMLDRCKDLGHETSILVKI